MRNTAQIKYREALNDVKNGIMEAQEKKDDGDDMDDGMKEAHIDCTKKMLSKILEADEDAQKLKILPRFADMWATFEDAILEDTQTFQSTMKQLHKKKKNMVTYCQRTMKEEELLTKAK